MDDPPEYLNVGSSSKAILGGMGLTITDQNGSCDATLTFRLTAEALGASYSPGGLCYTGSNSAPGLEAIAKTIENRKEPPEIITIISGGSCNKSPERAPFSGMCEGELLDSLAYFWGPRVYVEALDNKQTRDTATKVLRGTRPDDDLINALIHMLPKQKRAVPDILENMGDTAQPAIPYIKSILLYETENLAVRIDAAHVLSRMDALTPEGNPAFLEMMGMTDIDFDARREVAQLLGWMKPVEEALDALMQTLATGDEELRMLSLYGLGVVGTEAVPYIIQALNDESDNVRATASAVLGNMGVEAIPPILQAMRSAEEKGREAATEALKDLSGHDFGRDLLQWQDWWDEMTSLMASITTKQQIISSLDSEEIIIRLYAIDKVTQMDLQFIDAVPELVNIMEKEPKLAYLSAEALIAVGSEAVPALMQTITSEDVAVNYLSIYALGELVLQR